MENNIDDQVQEQVKPELVQAEKIENSENVEVETVGRKKKSGLVWLLGVVLVIFAGVGGFFFINREKMEEMVEQPSVKVNVALKWLNQAQFTGNYMALDQGYYKENGLDVTLIPYDLKTSAIDLVASGSAMFGVVGADELLLARSKGVPVVALAVIYQESPVVAYTLKSSGIESVADFKGKKIGYEISGNVTMTIDNMILEGGLDPQKDIIRVPIGYNADQLISGEVDVATGYMTNEPLYAEEEGYDVVYIRPSQYGLQNYSDVLFTSQEVIDKDPELVRGYVKATLEGWEKAFEYKDLAIESVMNYLDDKSQESRQHQKRMLEASEPLIQLDGNNKLGEMNYARWHRLLEEMKVADIITKNIDVSQAYNLEFLEY